MAQAGLCFECNRWKESCCKSWIQLLQAVARYTEIFYMRVCIASCHNNLPTYHTLLQDLMPVQSALLLVPQMLLLAIIVLVWNINFATTSTSVYFLLSFHRPLKSQTCFWSLDTILRLGISRTSTWTRVSHSGSYWSKELRKEAGLQEENAGALAGWERPGHRVWWPNMAAASRLSEAVRRRHSCKRHWGAVLLWLTWCNTHHMWLANIIHTHYDAIRNKYMLAIYYHCKTA